MSRQSETHKAYVYHVSFTAHYHDPEHPISWEVVDDNIFNLKNKIVCRTHLEELRQMLKEECERDGRDLLSLIINNITFLTETEYTISY